jgi:hypothetical protein
MHAQEQDREKIAQARANWGNHEANTGSEIGFHR